MKSSYTVTAPADQAGQRVDRFLAAALPDLSRTRIQALLQSGQVARTQKGEKSPETLENAAAHVCEGDVFDIVVPPPSAAVPEPQDIALDVLFEDESLIVIDKPPGLVVHPAAGNLDGTLVNALLAHCRGSLSGIGGVARPGIVHRLDKGTGGIMVAAKTDAAHQGLAAQFAAHDLERSYFALVWGVPKPLSGMVRGNIGRSPTNRKKMAVVTRGGKHACTHYRVIETIGTTMALVACRLETGRTHQIRVHMASLGHPVVGDPLYGKAHGARLKPLSDDARTALAALDSQMLYAFLLGFKHPVSGEQLRFERPLPQPFKQLMEKIA